MTDTLEAPSAWRHDTRGLVWREPYDLDRPDWFSLGEAFYASQFLRPVFLEVSAEGLPPLLIDVWERSFWWDIDLNELPRPASGLQIAAVYPHLVDIPPQAGRDIEILLWEIGNASLGDGIAPWLDADGRHRLRRWPNLMALPHTGDQMRMTSILAQAPLTAQELASVSQVTAIQAQTLINVYSLMGLTRSVADSPGPPLIPAVNLPPPEWPTPNSRQPNSEQPDSRQPDSLQRSASKGLFARLRTRFGR